jgi:tetratricopeptide (TPR) repeat protein
LKQDGIEAGAGYAIDETAMAAGGDAGQCLAQGDAYFYRGDLTKALRWYSRAMERSEKSMDPWIALLHLLLIKGDLREAHTWVVRGFQIFPDAPQLKAIHAVLQARKGMMRQAMNSSDAVLEQDGAMVLAHMARGMVLVLAGSKNADFCFDQCLKLAPGSWKTAMLIGMILQERRMWAKAIHYYAKAAEINENEPAVWYRVGLCRAALAHKAQAVKAYQRALDLCAEDDPLIQKISHAPKGSIFSRLFSLFR